jgi:hypothetical protein
LLKSGRSPAAIRQVTMERDASRSLTVAPCTCSVVVDSDRMLSLMTETPTDA